jgi:mannose-1-phosphate guanylyltransferase/mannose-6-phosphate isomerase
MFANMTHSLLPVIMAGGSGTRLWPLSRALYPKQFLVLTGNQSLFQQAHLRLQSLAAADITVAQPCVVGNEEHRFLVLDQLREVKGQAAPLLLEPVGRNTAPAVTLAALQAVSEGADPILVVTPADQTVTDEAAYTAAVQQAVRAAAEGDIVILGITPDRPETGFGYIRTGEANAQGARSVQAFVEKPDAETAQAYVADGGYFWNSGMFVMKASRWLAALGHFRPDILAATEAAFAVRATDAPFVRPGQEAFQAVPSESVDYAVMEQCPAHPEAGFVVRMVPLNAGWSDLGAWDAVWQVTPHDAKGNAAQGDALFHGTTNTLIHASSRLVAAVGWTTSWWWRRRTPCWWPIAAAARRSSRLSPRWRASLALKAACTAACTALGGGTTRSMRGSASRSSASWSNRRRRSACRCTTTAPSTGSW